MGNAISSSAVAVAEEDEACRPGVTHDWSAETSLRDVSHRRASGPGASTTSPASPVRRHAHAAGHGQEGRLVVHLFFGSDARGDLQGQEQEEAADTLQRTTGRWFAWP